MKSTEKKNPEWFVKDRFGMFIHWGIYALAARHEKVRALEPIPPDKYNMYSDLFDPDLFNPKAWAETAYKAGMKYLVFTAKHHDGFCMWDSQYTDFKVTNTPCGRDLLKEIVDAFRAKGIKIGLYYSLLDWHHPEFTVDLAHPERNTPGEREKNTTRDMRKYARYMRDQVTELLTGYGRIDIMWFDFSYPCEDGKGAADWESEKLVETVSSLQPHVLLDNRLDYPESADIFTPEQYIPSGGVRDEGGNLKVWEGCHTFSGSWGYYRDEYTWKSVKALLSIIIKNTSRGGNTLLNVGPNGRGRFDKRAQDRLDGIAEWMDIHNRSIHNCTIAPKEFIEPEGCRFTYNPDSNRLYLHIFDWPLKELHLEGFRHRLKYAQLLNDASEVQFRTSMEDENLCLVSVTPDNAVTLLLPIRPPEVEIPVIELFLR